MYVHACEEKGLWKYLTGMSRLLYVHVNGLA